MPQKQLRKRRRRKNEAEYELQDVEVKKVDLVGSPATGDTFLVIRSDEDEDDVVEELNDSVSHDDPNDDTDLDPEDLEEIVRQVPSADASSEDKRKAQKARSKKFGIEALEGKGENLSYPSGDPTTLNLYGDPVNLNFPLGYDDNKISAKRAANARVRFKQNAGRYSKDSSKRVVHNRIVKAEISAGAKPKYDENDALDKLLSADIKKKLKRSDTIVEAETMLNDNESKGLSPEFQQRTVETLKDILKRNMDLIKTVQEMPVDDEGSIVLPENILDGLHDVGVDVARAIVDVGEIDSEDIVWASIERAGAKMATTRLKRFRDAISTLSKILEELETKREKDKMSVKRDETQATQEVATQTPEVQVAPQTQEAPAVESAQVSAQTQVQEQKTQPEQPVTRSDELTLKDMMAKLEEIQRGQVDSSAKADQSLAEMKQKMEGLEQRVAAMEQVSRGSNQQPQEETGAVERSEKPKRFWGNKTGLYSP